MHPLGRSKAAQKHHTPAGKKLRTAASGHRHRVPATLVSHYPVAFPPLSLEVWGATVCSGTVTAGGLSPFHHGNHTETNQTHDLYVQRILISYRYHRSENLLISYIHDFGCTMAKTH